MKKFIISALLIVTSFAANAGVGGWKYGGTDIYGTVFHYKNVEKTGGGHVLFDVTAKSANGTIITLLEEVACRSGYSRQVVYGRMSTWEVIPPNTITERMALEICKQVS